MLIEIISPLSFGFVVALGQESIKEESEKPHVDAMVVWALEQVCNTPTVVAHKLISQWLH